jgi:SpoIID/LytB domain protein
MRHFSLPVALLAALAFSASASAATLFVVKGKGWGHGVGMSQWGAQGRALRGDTFDAILGFYYQNTTLGPASKSKVRVLLASGRSSVTISSAGPFKVGARTLSEDTAYRVVPAADGKVRIVGVGKFPNPVTASSPGPDYLRLNGARYRGSFRLWVRSGDIAVVNLVALQGYLYSVVPREMPSWFELEALKAQAVAARSYAIRAQRASWFDLYATTADQVYGGLESGEPPRAVTAVQQTDGKVVLYGSTVAQTFFSASNGGHTAASVDTWGGNPGYLNSRSDDADLTPGNPNRSWRVLFRPRELGSKLGTRAPQDAVVTDRASGRVRSLRLTGSDWSRTFTELAEYFRNELDLKSSRFWMGVQSLRANKKESQCRRAVRLSVFAHGVGSISLQQRRTTSNTWTTISLRKVDATHWTATRHPCVSMDYRVRSSDAVGPRIHVDVSPDVAFDATQRAGALTGKVNPLLAGHPVTVQRRTSSGWISAATAPIAEDGSFRAAFEVAEGRYRARVRPPASTGLTTGYSPVLHVVTG